MQVQKIENKDNGMRAILHNDEVVTIIHRKLVLPEEALFEKKMLTDMIFSLQSKDVLEGYFLQTQEDGYFLVAPPEFI